MLNLCSICRALLLPVLGNNQCERGEYVYIDVLSGKLNIIHLHTERKIVLGWEPKKKIICN